MHNPAGPLGAYAADLLYQLFGLAAWLPVLVSLSWGVRLVLGRPLAWPWLPIFSLPLALLALTAFLSVLPPLSPESLAVARRARAGRSATCNGAGSSPGSAGAGSLPRAWS